MDKEKQDLALISEKDLTLVDDKIMNANQLQFILTRTPKRYVKERDGRGGIKFKYVSGGYIKKCLNLMFGWDWDFEIVDEKIVFEAKQVIIKGRLTCRVSDKKIVKMQYGRADIKFKRDTKEPLDLGNDLKAAATDCLKKCAAELGIAADIYNSEEFREVNVKEAIASEKEYEKSLD